MTAHMPYLLPHVARPLPSPTRQFQSDEVYLILSLHKLYNAKGGQFIKAPTPEESYRQRQRLTDPFQKGEYILPSKR